MSKSNARVGNISALMRYVISLILLLSILWLALSGVYKPLLLILGGGSVALVVWLSLRMEVVGVEHNPVIYSWRLPLYWAWLTGQIVMANLHVAGRILAPGSIRPRIVRVPAPHYSSVARVTYANSCTLTPGTVALQLTRDELTAHALDDASAVSLEDGSMADRITWLENHSSSARSP